MQPFLAMADRKWLQMAFLERWFFIKVRVLGEIQKQLKEFSSEHHQIGRYYYKTMMQFKAQCALPIKYAALKWIIKPK